MENPKKLETKSKDKSLNRIYRSHEPLSQKGKKEEELLLKLLSGEPDDLSLKYFDKF